MTVAPGARLRQLAEAATPGPWRNAGWHVYAGDRFTVTHYPIAAIHTDLEADATLAALAPSLADLCADMADALDGLVEWGIAGVNDKNCDCESCARWKSYQPLLARFRALTQEPT